MSVRGVAGPWRQEGAGTARLCHRSDSALTRLPAVSGSLPPASLGAPCVVPTPECRRLFCPMRVLVPACWCWFQSSVVCAQFHGPGNCRDESPTESLKIFSTAHYRKTETQVNSDFHMHRNHLIKTPPAGPYPRVRVSDLRALEWCPRMCISHKFPGDVDAADRGLVL